MAKLIYTACPASVVIPGLTAAMTPQRFPEGGMYPQFAGRIRNLTYDTPPGNTTPVDYIWNNVKHGSYIYYSGNHIACHVQMGLYGAVIKDSDPNEAYPGIGYDQEVLLFYSEIDPAFHEAVATGNYGPGKTMTSTINYHPKYFLVNGAPFVPGQLPISAGSQGDNILVRLFNAGLETHVAQFQNLRGTLLADDGWPLNYQTDQYSFELQALKTKDVLLQPAAAGTYPVYDRRLRLTNANMTPGGLISFLQVNAASPPAQPLGDCLGDLDNSGSIDLLDLIMLANDWLQPCPGCPADFNTDDKINLIDYTIWLNAFSSGCP
jgi:FtsP/CotA-like multicopper oxidase with cupredoxin domain